ncbi:MAG: xanthine dehydrogenase family protein molybdopterin-binding subunit, partial [Gemmatimonadales bacterium]
MPTAPTVGTSVPRREGVEKVTGAARYTDDLRFSGAWYGATIRSTVPRGRLRGVTLDPAFDWSRVVVVTAQDIPGDNVVQLIQDDQPALAEDQIRHREEPVVLIAAPDIETLAAARAHVKLDQERLDPVLDIESATQVFSTVEIAKGDVDAGLKGADLVIERQFRVGLQEQLYIEPQAVIAMPWRETGDGIRDTGVTVYGSLQCPFYVHRALKRALGLGDSQVRVIQAETGGGFGGKEEYPSMLAIHAALLARKAGRPVRLIYDRHEDLAATTKRHPGIVTHRTGVTKDGALVAQDIE